MRTCVAEYLATPQPSEYGELLPYKKCTVSNVNLNFASLDAPADFIIGRLQYEDHGPRPIKAVSGCPAGSPVIMLAHQPKAAKLCLDTLDQLDLILSGKL